MKKETVIRVEAENKYQNDKRKPNIPIIILNVSGLNTPANR